MWGEIVLWLKTYAIEIFGVISGLLYLVFSIRQNIWLWPLGLITSALYIYVFFTARLYADMGLQVYYLLVSLYGWYNWKFHPENEEKQELPISTLNKKSVLILFGVSLLIYGIIAFILVNFTDGDIPYWDAFTTAFSITATWMLARKILEQWLVWIVVDAVSMGLYIYKGLYPTVILFFVYTTLAIVGYIKWKKDYQRQNV